MAQTYLLVQTHAATTKKRAKTVLVLTLKS